MITIKHHSIFHKAGQGQFYSAKISCNNTNINYVIDCGTQTKGYNNSLDNEIKTYVNSLKANEKLDYLIISHLHSDHISGVDTLLTKLNEKKTEVSNVFLPYLSKETRIYLYLKWMNQKGIKQNTLSFIINPIKFLKKYRVKKIRIVHMSDRDDKSQDFPDLDIRDKFSWDNDEKIEDSIYWEMPRITSGDIEWEDDETVSNIRNCKINFLLDFDFWYKSCDSKELSSFKKAIEDKYKDLDKIESETLKGLLSDKTIKEAYSKLQKNFNDTSLCVSITASTDLVQEKVEPLDFNGYNPVRYTRVCDERKVFNELCSKYLCDRFCSECQFFREFFIENHVLKQNVVSVLDKIRKFDEFEYYKKILERKWMRYTLRFGYIFTGDINLFPQNNGEVSETTLEFLEHYNSKAERIGNLVVPHHGAKKNWDKRLLAFFCLPHSIVSSGFNSQYGHPHAPVVNDISNSWSWANENHECVQRFYLRFNSGKVQIGNSSKIPALSK